MRSRQGLLAVLRDEVSVDLATFAVEMVTTILPQFSFNRIRTLACRALGMRIGPRSHVMGPVRFSGQCPLHCFYIGSDSFVSGPLTIDLGAPVTIGNGVHLGHDVLVLTIDHDVGPHSRRCGERYSAPIVIGDGAWLGSRVTVLPGVSVGAGAVVASNTVVALDVPPNTLVAGSPARVVRTFGGREEAHRARRALRKTPSGF